RAALEVFELGCSLEQTDVPGVAATDMNGDVLLAVDRVADRRRGDRRADVETPQRLQLLVVEGGEGAVDCAGKDEAAGGRQYAGIIGIVELGRRFDLAGCHIDRGDLATHPFSARPDPAIPEWAAHAGLVDLELGAAVDASTVGQVL